MWKHLTWVSTWYSLGLIALALTALNIGTFGHHPWVGATFGMVCIIWARVEQMERRYCVLVGQYQLLLDFLYVLFRESGNPPSVPPV